MERKVVQEGWIHCSV